MSLPPRSLRQASSNHDTAYLARRSGVSPLLAPGDSVIDGRNSGYVDDIQRGKTLISMWGARVGAELDAEAGSKAARLAALNALAVAREHLGTLDRVTRIVRLGVSVATSGDVRDQPKVADGATRVYDASHAHIWGRVIGSARRLRTHADVGSCLAPLAFSVTRLGGGSGALCEVAHKIPNRIPHCTDKHAMIGPPR